MITLTRLNILHGPSVRTASFSTSDSTSASILTSKDRRGGELYGLEPGWEWKRRARGEGKIDRGENNQLPVPVCSGLQGQPAWERADALPTVKWFPKHPNALLLDWLKGVDQEGRKNLVLFAGILQIPPYLPCDHSTLGKRTFNQMESRVFLS